MNCLECQELLQARLDGAVAAPSPELDAHLGECMKCRELHACSQLLLDGLKKQAAPKLSTDYTRRVTRTLLDDRARRRRKLRSQLFITAALAASVVVMLLLGYAMLPRSPERPLDPVDDIAKHAPPKIDNKKPEPPPKSVEKQPDRPSVIAGLPDRWVDTTRQHANVVFAVANLDAVDNLTIDPAATEAAQEVSDGVRTVTVNTRKAFDFFAREFPMPDLGERRN